MNRTEHTRKNRFRRAAAMLLLVVMAAFSAVTLTACSRPPELETVKERFITLIEASAEVNDILFGTGLPYYAADSAFAKEHHIYDDVNINLASYRYVTLDAKYRSTEEIRAAARTVYSKAYMDNLEDTMFVSTAVSIGQDSFVSRARYAEFDGELWILTDWDNGMDYYGARTFDYDTLKMLNKFSSAGIVTVTVDASLPDTVELPTGSTVPRTCTMTLRFVLEDGEWMLDSPTY